MGWRGGGVAARLSALFLGVTTLVAGGCGGDASPRATRDPLLTTAVPKVVVEDCGRAAEKMDRSVVYCPPLVPKGPAMSQNRSSRGRVSIEARGAAYQLHFVSPSLQRRDPADPGRFVHLGHWTFGAYSPRGLSRHDPLRSQSFRALTRGDGARHVGRIEIAGVPVTVVEVSENGYTVHSGHVLAVWKMGRRVFNVSLHGFERRRTAVEMARAIIQEAQG